MDNDKLSKLEKAAGGSSQPRILNVNLGILGHVDSGKTSLTRALSTVLSTAALDKNPQSQERGITLDLGFSAFQTELPSHLKGLPYEKLQFTLVDCPGHASLIRTVIGGAQIMDLMILVIDINKGIQTQTAECLVLAEITTEELVVVLNKVDMIPKDTRAEKIEKVKKGLKKAFASTRFADAPMICLSAAPGAGNGVPENLDELTGTLLSMVKDPKREVSGPFVFAMDHCFAIKGQGTVMTGTVLSGSVKVNQDICIPELKIEKKVKSMQMFKKPVQQAIQGDRVGICVAQLDPKLLERGLAADPSCIITLSYAIIDVTKIRFFKGECLSKAKFHISVGHTTQMAKATFFGKEAIDEGTSSGKDAFVSVKSALMKELPIPEFDSAQEFLYQDNLGDPKRKQYALLEFEQPISVPKNSLFIGSKLDTDITSNTCRLVFYGRLAHIISDKASLSTLKIYKHKERSGVVDRVQDDSCAIGNKMFNKDADIGLFANMKVELSNGMEGTIESAFGKTGKFKVRIPAGGLSKVENATSLTMTMRFRKFIFDENKKNMTQ